MPGGAVGLASRCRSRSLLQGRAQRHSILSGPSGGVPVHRSACPVACVDLPGCTCGCFGCGCGPSFRRFFSSKEEQECLDSYRDQLEKELAAVKERISKIET
jgi:hypothetical protein